MNVLKVVLIIAAFYLVVLAVRVIAVIVANNRRSDALLNKVFKYQFNLPMHLAFLLMRGKPYLTEWKTYKIIKRGVAREKAEQKRLKRRRDRIAQGGQLIPGEGEGRKKDPKPQ
jgi:hypothetical protein